MSDKPFVFLVGSSGHARVIIDIVEQENRYQIAGLLDAYEPVGKKIMGYPVLGSEKDLPELLTQFPDASLIIAIGDNDVRRQVRDQILEHWKEAKFANAIHPAATIGRGVQMGNGVVVMAGAVVNPLCHLHDFSLVNTRASLDHESVLEEFSSLAPGATTGGNVQVGKGAVIAIGATVLHGVSIGAYTVLGAAALLTQNTQEYELWYGVPAKKIRDRGPGEKYL